jgi:hypothetical protein
MTCSIKGCLSDALIIGICKDHKNKNIICLGCFTIHQERKNHKISYKKIHNEFLCYICRYQEKNTKLCKIIKCYNIPLIGMNVCDIHTCSIIDCRDEVVNDNGYAFYTHVKQQICINHYSALKKAIYKKCAKCGISINKENPFCVRCENKLYCMEKNCYFGFTQNLNFCSLHECKFDNCHSGETQNEYCMHHTCNAYNCTNKIYEFNKCTLHYNKICKVVNCFKYCKYTASTYCPAHECVQQDCINLVTNKSMCAICDKLWCPFITRTKYRPLSDLRCKNPILTSDACEKHQCKISDCSNLVYNEDSQIYICQDHYCINCSIKVKEGTSIEKMYDILHDYTVKDCIWLITQFTGDWFGCCIKHACSKKKCNVERQNDPTKKSRRCVYHM